MHMLTHHMQLTGRLVEVALEDVLVEDEQRLEDLEGVLVGGLLSDLEVQVLVRQGLLRAQALERQRRRKVRRLIWRRVCRSGRVHSPMEGAHSGSWRN